MSGYIGNIPVPQATQTRQSFTATASQTTFATIGYTPNFVDVYMNGVHLLDGTDYTATNGSDIVLTTGAAAGDVIEVVAYSTFQVSEQNFIGGLTVDNDGATVLTVDRATSDGTIIDVQRGGTSTAVIGVSAGDDVYFAGATGSSKGIYFNANGLLPATTGGSASDGTVDIGENITRWKDLYLSGGVYLGGTGAANKLQDYEEGTWTPVLSTTGSAPTIGSYTSQSGTYTKIGNMVIARCRIRATVTSGGGGNPKVTGLPFTNLGGYSGVTMGLQNLLQLDASAYDRTSFPQGATYGVSTEVTFYSMIYVTGSNNYLEFTVIYNTSA